MTTQEYKAFETCVKNLKHIVTRNQNYEFAAMLRDLEKDIKSEEDGPLGRIFRSLASGDRPWTFNADESLAQEEAKQLFAVNFNFAFYRVHW